MATFEHVVDLGEQEVTKWYWGSWTSESSAADHTIYFPHPVMYFQVLLDSSGTNPNLLIKHTGNSADTYVLDGGPTQALATSPTDATGVTITNNGNKCTALVDSNSQANSGVNVWIAACKVKGSSY